jgi:hypothetical protein
LEIPVTLTFIAMCGLALLPMTGWIGVHRASERILRGDGGDPVLFKRIRIHGNFIENAPITALTLGGAEMLGLASMWLWLGLAAFVAGRIVHYLLYDRPSRGIGMTLTTLPAAAWGGWILWTVWL